MPWDWEMQGRINERDRKIKQLEKELEEARKPNFCYAWDFGKLSDIHSELKEISQQLDNLSRK
jgi:hypothetical protein